MKRYFLLFIFAITFFSTSYGESKPYYIIDGQYEDNGVTKLWYTVLGLADQYDKKEIAGFKINFDCNGKHYSPKKDKNWWKYYFAFTSIGSPEGAIIKRLPRHKRSTIRFETVCTMPPKRASFLLSTYIPFQPKILELFNQIKKENWPNNSPVIGVYYQHPMMSEVQSNWSPELLLKRVTVEAKKHPKCSIILLTDLDGYDIKFNNKFNENVTSLSLLVERKEKPGDIQGEIEVLTLLLLSQCDFLITPGSYQGIGAKMLNPSMNLIELDTIPYALK